MVLGVDVVVVLAEHVRVFHIGRSAFQAVQAQQAQAENVLANRCFVFVWGEFSRLTLQIAEIVAHQLKVRHRVFHAGVSIRLHALRLQRFTQGNGFAGIANNARRVEVNVGQRGEEGARGEAVDVVVDDAIFAGFKRPCGKALQGGNQQVLQVRCFCGFAAHTLCVRAAIACRGTDGLFTLHTKHNHTC